MASTLNSDNGVVSGSAGLKSSADSTGVLALQTNGTTAVTVGATQLVSIGTASPSASYGLLTVAGPGISITPDTSSKFQIGRYSAGAPYSYIKMGSTSSGLKFTDPADSVDLMTLSSTGALALYGASTSATGVGITFPATQSASTDANTLDDYEEGTFTPSITFGGGSTGITYDAVRRIGTYTRIGNKVFYFIHIELTSKGSSTGAVLITGLPFTSTGTDAYVPAAVFLGGMASITGQFMPRTSTGSTNIDIYQVVSSTYSAITNTNFTNTTGLQLSGMYSA